MKYWRKTLTIIIVLLAIWLLFFAKGLMAWRYPKNKIHSPNEIKNTLCIKDKSFYFPIILFVDNNTINFQDIEFKRVKICSQLAADDNFLYNSSYKLPDNKELKIFANSNEITNLKIIEFLKNNCNKCNYNISKYPLSPEEMESNEIDFFKLYDERTRGVNYWIAPMPPIENIIPQMISRNEIFSNNLSESSIGLLFHFGYDSLPYKLNPSEQYEKLYNKKFDIFEYKPMYDAKVGINFVADKSKKQIISINCWENYMKKFHSKGTANKNRNHCFDYLNSNSKKTDFVAQMPIFFIMFDD